MSGGSYYDERIKEEERNLYIYSRILNACLSVIDFKNELARNSVRKKVYKIINQDYESAVKTKLKLSDELNRVKLNSNVLSYKKVEAALEEELRFRKDDPIYHDISRIARNISNDPLVCFEEYTREYINSKQKIENYKKLKSEKAQVSKRNREIEQDRENRTNSNYSHSTYTSENEPKRKESIPYSSNSDEEAKRQVEAMIDRKLADKYNLAIFSIDEEKRIEQLYPELNNSSYKYHSVKTLQNGMWLDQMSNRKDLDINDIMQLGFITLDIVTKELVEGANSKTPEVFKRIHMKDSLDKYQKAYDRFIKNYNKLSPQIKSNVDKTLERNERYVNTFGNSVVTPDKMKKIINSTVIDIIIRNHDDFYGTYEKNYFSKTLYASRYMSVEEVAILYKGIKKEEEKLYTYARDDEERERFNESKKKMLEKLQTEFARVIQTKLGNGKQVDISRMSEDEKKEYYKKESAKLAEIITGILGETPISEGMKEISLENEGKENLIKSTYEAKEEAKARVIGVTGFQKALAQMSGKWDRYLMLMDKEELTEKEQEELKGMFK